MTFVSEMTGLEFLYGEVAKTDKSDASAAWSWVYAGG